MKSGTIIFATCLMLLFVSSSNAQVGPKPGAPKPNGPANKTRIPNKPPPTLPSAKSDLAAGVSVYVDSQKDMVVMEALVTNYGPNAISYGQRTITFTAIDKGKTWSFIKDAKIPALKGSAITPGQQAGSSYALSHSVPVLWGFDESTVYEVKISASKTDPNASNDVAKQVGFNKGKP